MREARSVLYVESITAAAETQRFLNGTCERNYAAVDNMLLRLVKHAYKRFRAGLITLRTA